ncbi:membrane protein YdbS with pleckstrin-like domain [Microbacterium resistens]|uniref:Membrane protein YdbS with pleckstrin-like domain n=1 Tax=Microbacterium resistens TaxID=156977 RepID=A0ABU1SEL4_9MICO|nr:YrdB family protein [Microbacterium resistens]MDR6868047.1 membrane protein YdbS with pleckstrin-like domain [Microbacterium resistens]
MSSTPHAPATPGMRPRATALDIVRVVVLLVAMSSLVLWGLVAWAMPWNIITAIGAPLIVLLVWALFLSPRPVLAVHPFVRALVELVIYAGVTIAWWSLGQTWIGLGFAVVAVATGLVAGRRAFG